MYGYGKVATPALDALRKDSVLFERAYSHVPLTLPSHTSLFTGLEPGMHGVLDNSGYRLPTGDPTLAELLKKAGYATGGAVSAAVLGGRSGIGRGFDLWRIASRRRARVAMLDFVERPGGETAGLLLGWIRANAGPPLFRLSPHLRTARAARGAGAVPLAVRPTRTTARSRRRTPSSEGSSRS